MADNLGLNQTRVLDTAERNFESVTYQRKKPPLSCEVNLTGKLAAEHVQNSFSGVGTSGWACIGSIKDSETNVKTGDIICSASYDANTIKTPSTIAWVNGMRVVVEGTNNTSEDNIIDLSPPPTNGARADFVFLEVWRKLVTPTDTVYKNGNILYQGSNPTNDLIDPAIDIETSLRIQIQYRIRVAECDIQAYPEGFDPSRVFLQGPLSSPLSGSNYFIQMENDPGLWRAGAGDEGAQELTGTVDGYTYAIPICVVARRCSAVYDPINTSNGAGRSLADYISGLPSDRPDNKYNDYIVADDILDMRHIVSSNVNPKEYCEKAFRKLIKGELRGKMSKNLVGQDHYGVVLVQPDGIAPDNPGWFTKIGYGNSIRRVFANTSYTQEKTLTRKTITEKDIGSVVGPWVSGDSATVSATDGAVSNVSDVYVTGLSNAISLKHDDLIVPANNGYIYKYSYGGWSSQTYANTIEKMKNVGDFYMARISTYSPSDLYKSYDASNWSPIYYGTYTVEEIAWNADSLVVFDGVNVKTSLDRGITWPYTQTLSQSYYKCVWGNGQYVAICNSNSVTSPDGITWTEHLGVLGTVSPNDIKWNGTYYIISGYDWGTSSGTILISTNGISWSSRPVTYSSNNYLSVAVKGATAVAVSSNGLVITSLDWGFTWNSQTSNTTDSLIAVSWTGNQFIAGGSNSGEVIVSSDGLAWVNTGSQLPGSSWNYFFVDSVAMIDDNTINVTTSSFQSYPLTFNYTIDYIAGPNGFSQLPTTVLESRGEASDSLSMASNDQDIPVRSLLNSSNNMLSNRGYSSSSLYDFGHQMIYHVKGTGSTQITVPNPLFGYNILGITSLYDGLSYRTITDVTKGSSIYTIHSSPAFTLGADMTLNLYTDGRFFQTTKQGRGILDSHEMRLYTPMEVADGVRTTFSIDTTNKAILKIASNNQASGYGIAYVNGIQKTLLNSNSLTLSDATASRLTVSFSLAPVAGSVIQIPVLTKSPLSYSEGVVIYYSTLPYQGLLKSETGGIIEAEGPAILTTSGSGSIDNTGFGQKNVFDRMPTLSMLTDCSGYSENIGIGNNVYSAITRGHPVLETIVRSRPQDILDQNPINIHIGTGTADRGRKTIHIDGADLGLGNLGLRYEFTCAVEPPWSINYRKSYQSYILNKDSSGELYLMVVSGETNNEIMPYLNEASNNDTVDIFRLSGRPIKMKRID